MKVLILSEYGEGLGLAKKIQDEGHSVDIFIKHRVGLSGEEIVSVIDSWRPLIPQADLIISSDGDAFSSHIDMLREKGKPLFNFSPHTALGPNLIPQFFGWFNGRDWIEPLVEFDSYMRMLTGDLGPVVCSMGTIARRTSEAPKSAEDVAPELKRAGFKGPFGGLGHNAVDLLIEGLREPITDLIFETATGTKKEMDLTEDSLICVRVTSDVGHRLIEGITEEGLKHIHLYNVSKDLAGNYYSWGGTVLKVTARGRTVKEARRRVYRTLNNIELDDKQYRTDIGEQLEH